MDKFKEYLKSLGYSDEDITKIVAGMNDKKLYITQEEHIEDRYAKSKTKLTDLEKQLKAANDTIEGLKKNGQTSEELQAKITQYEQDMEKLKTESAKQLFDSALETELIKINVHSTKAARAELDLEKVKFENGQFTGLKEQTDTWSKDKPFLIKTGQTKTTYNPAGGGDPGTESLAAKIAAQRNTGNTQQTDNPYASAWGTK